MPDNKAQQYAKHVLFMLGFPILLGMLLFITPCSAAEPADDPEGPTLLEADCTPDINSGLTPEAEPPFFEFLDSPQRTVSSGINSLAQTLDEFFANEKVLYEKSGSYIRLTGDLFFEEPGQMHTLGDIKVRLRIPRTQKKIGLLLESDPDEQRSTKDRVTDQTPETEEGDRNLYAGIQAELGKEEKWKFKPSVGAKLRFPIEYYVRLRANRTYQYEKWRLYLSETPYWFDTTGFGFDSGMEWSYPLTNNLLFRSNSVVRYTDERDMFDFSQVLSLSHTLSSSRAITYEAAAFADSEPAIYATSYLLQMRYRQRVHSDYLFLEIVPKIEFLKETGFEDENSLLLRVEFLFQG